MSRTRIVGGNITKITGGKYKIFAKDNIEFHSNKQVIQNAKEGIFHGEPEKPTEVKTEYLIKGEWRDDKNNVITKAKVGTHVKFCIETKDIPPRTPIKVELIEFDGNVYIPMLGLGYVKTRPFDDDIPLYTASPETKGTVSFTHVIINDEGKAEFGIELSATLDSYIDDDSGRHIELYFKCTYEGYETDLLPKSESNYLEVGYSDRNIFIKPAINDGNYSLPEIYSHTGEIILFVIKESPEQKIHNYIKLKVRTTTQFVYYESIEKLKKEIYTETINLKTNTIENINYTIDDVEYIFSIKDDGGKVFIDEKIHEIPIAKGSKIGIYNSIKKTINVVKGIGELYDQYLILDEMKNMIPELSNNGKFNMPSLSTLIGFIPGGGVLAFGVAVSEWVVKDMLKQYDEWIEEGKKVHFENSKASGLKYVKNLLHMNPWFKDEYWYVENVPYATLQKLLKGKIRRFDKLNNDIDKENTNLTSVFYSGQISPDEFARNKYFLIFKIQHNEQQNDDIFILETVFYEN